MRRQTEGFQTKTDADLYAHPPVATSATRWASVSGAEHARRDPDACCSGWRSPARSTAPTSPTTTGSASPPGLAVQRPRQRSPGRAGATRSSAAATSSTCRTTKRAAATGWGTSSSIGTPRTRSTRTSRISNALLGVCQSVHRNRAPIRAASTEQDSLGVLRAGHVAPDDAADGRLRRAVPLVHAVRGVPTSRSPTSIRPVRSGAGAAPLSARAIVNGARSRSIRSPGRR